MRHLFGYLAVFLTATTLAASQETKTQWTNWIPATNATYKDRYGIEHDRTDFSYRYRLSVPCSGKDCSIDLQLRNNSERRESINYIISVEQESGHTALTRDHRNLDASEIQDIPVYSYGQRITKVKIE